MGTNKRGSVTLIGDAAHVMTPFAGVGVNVGMQDALELAKRIIARKGEWTSETDLKVSIAAATKEFELEMWPRAKANAEKTWEYLGIFFNPIGAEEMVRYFGNIKMLEDKAKEEAKAKEDAEAAEKVNASEGQVNGDKVNEIQVNEIQVDEVKVDEPKPEDKPVESTPTENTPAENQPEIKPAEEEATVEKIKEAVHILVDA